MDNYGLPTIAQLIDKTGSNVECKQKLYEIMHFIELSYLYKISRRTNFNIYIGNPSAISNTRVCYVMINSMFELRSSDQSNQYCDLFDKLMEYSSLEPSPLKGDIYRIFISNEDKAEKLLTGFKKLEEEYKQRDLSQGE